MNAGWSNFFSALAGGAIAGVATLWAQLLSAKDQRKREEKAEATLIHGFVQAIADELKSFWDRHNLEIGPHLENLGENEAAIPFPVHQSYFVVFDTNASLIGRIPERELREQIISTYVEAKGFVDSLHFYERMVIEYEEYVASGKGIELRAIKEMMKDPQGPSGLGIRYNKLISYSHKLKTAHSILERKVKALQDSSQAWLDGTLC